MECCASLQHEPQGNNLKLIPDRRFKVEVELCISICMHTHVVMVVTIHSRECNVPSNTALALLTQCVYYSRFTTLNSNCDSSAYGVLQNKATCTSTAIQAMLVSKAIHMPNCWLWAHH